MRSWSIKQIIITTGLAAVIVGIGSFAARSTTAEPGWAFKGTWSDTCSCKISCPCLFGSEPTEGFCQGSSLLEVERGHYGGVSLDGLAAMVSYQVGEWVRIYIADSATPEQAKALAKAIPLTVPFMGMGETETIEVVPLTVERTETTLEYAVPESSVELEIVTGANGEPIRIANLPAKGLPFPEAYDHTQFRSVLSQHHSEAHQFEWSGRNGYVTKVDRGGILPPEGS